MFASGPIMSSSSATTAAGLAFTSNTAISNNNVTTPSIVAAAGSVMVLTCAAADDATLATDVAITGTTLTWTKQIEVVTDGANHYGMTEIWTAPCPAGGTISPTCTWGGGTTSASSSVLYAVTGEETTPAGASGSQVAQTAPSVGVLTTRINGVLFCVSSDWGAVAGAITYRDGATQVLNHDLSPTVYRGYHYYKLTTAIATYTEGISSPSTMQSSTCVLEIRTP